MLPIHILKILLHSVILLPIIPHYKPSTYTVHRDYSLTHSLIHSYCNSSVKFFFISEWNKWAHDQIRNWGRCIDYWINTFQGPKVVVFYEDLISDLKSNLILINEFLGIDLDERRLECTLQSQAQQKFHRKVWSSYNYLLLIEQFYVVGKYGNWITWKRYWSLVFIE